MKGKIEFWEIFVARKYIGKKACCGVAGFLFVKCILGRRVLVYTCVDLLKKNCIVMGKEAKREKKEREAEKKKGRKKKMFNCGSVTTL